MQDINEITKAVCEVFVEQFRSASFDIVTNKGYIDFDVWPEKLSNEVYDDALNDMEDLRKAVEPFGLQISISSTEHDYICFNLTSAVVEEQTGDQP